MKDPIDTADPTFVRASGVILRNQITNKIGLLSDAYKLICAQISDEVKDSNLAATLIVALVGGGNLNGKALIIKALAERGAFLEKEIQELKTLGQCFEPNTTYKISLDLAARVGL